MTKYYCDICGKEIPEPTRIDVIMSPDSIVECDLCSDCNGAIRTARENAEIKIVHEMRRKSR